LAITSKYKTDDLKNNLAFKYDLNNVEAIRLDNEVVYDWGGEWHLQINNSYNFETSTIYRANIALKKEFHCRELWFSYDHLNREFMVEYRLGLFPEHGIKFGSSEDEPFMFDSGIEDLIENE
jgi:hypothetical protein